MRRAHPCCASAVRISRIPPTVDPRFADYPILRLTTPRGELLEARVAASRRARTLGLARSDDPPEALMIPVCASVHTFGMRYAIDVAFVGWQPGGTGAVPVLSLREHLVPRRLATHSLLPGRGVATLELPAGAAAAHGISAGVELRTS